MKENLQRRRKMKGKLIKRVLTAVLCTAMMTGLLTGCGSSDAGSTAAGGGTTTASGSQHGGPYADEITIDVFDSQANFQGEQSGWFAKIVKDKFNMKLNIIAPNVAGGGDTLYQTRSANGNLGDLIITNLDSNRLSDMVSAGLVLDMSDYIGSCTNLQKYKDAITGASALAGKDGMWAVPSEVSTQPATEPCEATDPTDAPSLRWDVYGAVGYPEMKNMDDLLTVLKQMQDKAGTTADGKQCYALSLFKDWDGDIMQNAGALAALYGYEPVGFALADSSTKDVQSVIDSDGIYVKALKFLFDANQAGLVDPESTTQNFDTLNAKFTSGQILYSFWPWLGAGYYNSTDNTAAGKGFETAVIDDMKCLSYGSYTLGKMGNGMMIGSQAKDPQRIADFIDWLYSPEGVEDSCAQTGSSCGPEGMTWTNESGTPKLTDFGVEAFVKMTDGLQVPSDWGSGTWKDGVSALNYKALGLVDCDPDTGICYNYSRWDDYQKQTATKLSEDWSSHYDNAKTAIEYLNGKKMLTVVPGSNYAIPEYETEISTIKEQCKQIIVQDSWQMVFAASEDEFNADLKDMQDTVNGLGYDQVLAVDKQNCQDKFASYASTK